MKVFISHSMPRSAALAQALVPFLERVIPGVEPWISDPGIDKGALFPAEIMSNLTEAAAGIVCLTPENRDQRWILFEAGALSLKSSGRLWTLLLGMEHADVDRPLNDYNHTKAHDKADVLRMVKAIFKTLSDAQKVSVDLHAVEDYFEAFWPKMLEPKVQELLAAKGAAQSRQRSERELLVDLLEVVQQMRRRSEWKQEKTLQMLHQVYQATVGTPAPPLAELVAMAKRREEVFKLSDRVSAPMSGGPEVVITPTRTAEQEPES